jgi:hypothetical protein
MLVNFQLMFCVSRPQHLCGTFTDDDTRRHCVTGCHARHNRPIRNAKVVDSIDFEVPVYNRHCIATHLGGAPLVV